MVDVQRCTVSANQANGTVLGEGGGIYSDGSILTLAVGTARSTAYYLTAQEAVPLGQRPGPK